MLTAPAGLAAEPAGSPTHRILSLYERLRSQSDLAPSPVVDALFRDLVATCVRVGAGDAPAVLSDPAVQAVRDDLVRLCAEGETQLERAWSRRILAAADPDTETAAFPYHSNYRQLVRLELHALAGVGFHAGDAARIGFVGGGPLPLTALLLHRRFDADVAVVDRDAEAVELCGRLLDRLAARPRIEVVRADASSTSDLGGVLAGCDVVVVAALVGLQPAEKRAVLRAIAAAVTPGAYVVIRTAAGLRSLLYPVVEVGEVEAAGLAPEVLVHPWGEVINSVLVTRRR